MAKAVRIGTGKANLVRKIYIGGSDGQARRVRKAYIGDATGKARVFYTVNTGPVTEVTWGFLEDNHVIWRSIEGITFTQLETGDFPY